MKKTYISPAVETEQVDMVLMDNTSFQREVTGKAFTTEEVPGLVRSLDDWSHDNSGGQGEGETGNRANGSNLWED